MRRLTVADVEDLLVAEDDDLAEHLRHILAWHFERAMTTIRLSLGAAGSLMVAFLAAVLRPDSTLTPVEGGLIVGGAVMLLLYGLYMLTRTRSVHGDYVASLRLVRELAPLTPLLRLYRQ